LRELEELQRSTNNNAALSETLRRRAKLAGNEADRESFYHQAIELLGPDGSATDREVLFRELLELDDHNQWAIAGLAELCEASGNHKEALALLLRWIELGAAGSDPVELRYRAAVLANDKLGDLDSATTIYERLFDEDPTQARAAGALRELYEKQKAWERLDLLLERLTDAEDSAEGRNRLRLERAALKTSKLDDSAGAIEVLETALQEEATRSEVVAELRTLYQAAGRHTELSDLLVAERLAALERGDSAAELEFLSGLAALYTDELSDSTKAIETYELILERVPEHPEALAGLAKLLRQSDRFGEAARVQSTRVENADPSDRPSLLAQLCDDFEKAGDDPGLVGALEQSLELAPDDAELHARLIAAYEKLGSWEPLAELLVRDAEKATDVSAKVELFRKAADIHKKQRKDAAQCAELLSRASALVPDNRDLMLELCDAYSESGRGRDAVQVLERIVESYGGKRSRELGDIHRRLAQAYKADGMLDQAAEELDKARRIEPGNVAVLKELGQLALETGDPKKAQQMYRALLLQKLDDQSPISKVEVFVKLAEVHERLDEKAKAIQMAERAVQTDRDHAEAQALLERLKSS
jgi:tetratricopeptide (TPR) repeat protein